MIGGSVLEWKIIANNEDHLCSFTFVGPWIRFLDCIQYKESQYLV